MQHKLYWFVIHNEQIKVQVSLSRAFFITLFAFAFAFAPAIYAQNTASVNGYITDSESGETLISANIALLELNRGTSANTSGYYSITNLPPGTYTLVASYIGYRQYEREIDLTAGETLRVDIEMIPEGVELETVVVESEVEREEQRNIGTAQITTDLH